MAISNSQLIISPVLRQYFIDPTTLLPVVGTIDFFKTDKITPKNVFQQTFNPLDPFEVVAIPISLDTAGAIPFTLYLYPFDENDDEVEELYYIEVRRTDTSLVFALDDFPQNFVSGGDEGAADDLTNKCPSFGFDNPILAATYTLANQNPIPVNWATDIMDGARVAQGWVWQLEDVSNSELFYDVTPIIVDTRPGNPINLLTLSSGNIQTQTQNMIGFRLCVANELKDTIINYQLDLQDNFANLSTLDVFVFNGNDTTDLSAVLSVGTISISASLSLQTISFTMPDLSGSLVDDNAPTWLFLGLPLTQQFSVSMTSTFTYFGDNRTITRLPLAYSSSEGKQLTSLNAEELYISEDNFLQSDLPLTQRKGRLDFLKKTGEIFIASSLFDPTQNGANALNDRTLVRGDDIDNTLTSRFLDQAHLSPFGGNTFVISNAVGSVFDIETQDTAPSFSTWTSTNGDITITPTPLAGGLPLTSTVLGPVVTVTFDTSFNAVTEAFKDTASVISHGGKVNQSGSYDSNVILNMVGVYEQVTAASNADIDLTFTTGSVITITQLTPGNGGAASCTIEFTVGGFSSPTQIQSSVSVQFESSSFNSDFGIATDLFTNYFSFGDKDVGGAIIHDPPPYAIGFKIGNPTIPTSLNKTIIVDLTNVTLTDADALANALNLAINGGTSYEIEVVNVPTNGHLLSISTSNKTINLVMNDTDTSPTPPLKPDLRISTIFVDYSSVNDSTDQISVKIQTAIAVNIGSIPTFLDLGLATLPNNLLYYVYI